MGSRVAFSLRPPHSVKHHTVVAKGQVNLLQKYDKKITKKACKFDKNLTFKGRFFPIVNCEQK